jgi:hypothetical protein
LRTGEIGLRCLEDCSELTGIKYTRLTAQDEKRVAGRRERSQDAVARWRYTMN